MIGRFLEKTSASDLLIGILKKLNHSVELFLQEFTCVHRLFTNTVVFL